MQKTIEVVYEKGVFKPLEPVELKDGVKRRIVIEEWHFEKFFGIFKDKKISVEEERDLMISERA
ncbi:MAG: antitoxin family protein [Methanomicrobia archaeon]|nr:antitoxin family protein [Methanomicrobia archaeon]